VPANQSKSASADDYEENTMRLILPSQKQPLKPQGPQLFVDWRHISEGELTWMRDGKKASQWGGGEPPIPVADAPYGIRLEAVKAEVIGPMLPQDQPWELGYLMYVNTILVEDGKYRMWYTVVPDDFRYKKMDFDHDVGWVLCYAESDDGFNWTKPNLGLTDFEGHPTNWVYGRHLSPNAFASGAVFKDPSAPPEERYKLIYRGEERHDDMAAFIERQHARFGDDMDPKSAGGKPGKPGTCAVTAGAVSADGIHWKPLEEPVMMYCSDQMNVAMWDDSIQKYVGYFRMERAGRRSVGRSETADFREWSTPYPCLEVPLHWHPSTDIMHCPVLKYPGTDDVYIMLATLFHRNSDNRDVHFAVSADGLYWNWLPGETMATRTEGVNWIYDDIEAGYGIVPLPGDRIGIPVVAYEFPYKYPRNLTSGERKEKPLGEAGYATWKKDRLCAVVADDRGEFTTHKMVVGGSQLSLNLATYGHGGYVSVEVRDAKGKPVPGYTFAESDPISGDELDQRVTWDGKANFGDLIGQTVSLKVRMHMARLFAFQFV
jgi:hypothetical protein